MQLAPFVLGVVASILGVYYSALGVAAIRHLQSPSEADKVVGWTLWWCLESNRYDADGQRFCKQGQVVVLVCVALWIACFVVAHRP
jgi:hypothetical protein